MKKVEFRKVWMQNFCNHIDRVELEFGKGKLLLVTGPNGSGKTSMFQAIPYALYGQCEKGRAEDVLNDKVQKNCNVGVEFTIDEDLYRAERYVKYTKHGNTAYLFKYNPDTDEWIQKAKGHKEVVPAVEKLLVPYKLFTNTLLFGQKVKTFFTDLPDSEQKEIFRKILKLDDYVTYKDETGKLLKKLEGDVLLLNNQIFSVDELLKDAAEQIIKMKAAAEEFEVEKQKDIVKMEEKVAGIQGHVEEKQKIMVEYDNLQLSEKVERLSVEIGSLVERIQAAKVDSPEIEKLDSKAQIKRAELEKSAAQMTKQVTDQILKTKQKIQETWRIVDDSFDADVTIIDQSINKLNLELQEIESSIPFLEKEAKTFMIDPFIEVCPTCRQTIDKNVIAEFNTKEAEVRKKIIVMADKEKQLLQHKEIIEGHWSSKRTERRAALDKKQADLQVCDDEITEKETSVQERLTQATANLEQLVSKERVTLTAELTTIREKLQAEFAEKQQDRLNTIVLTKERADLDTEINQLENDSSEETALLEAKREQQYDDSMLKDTQKKVTGHNKKRKECLVDRDKLTTRLKILQFWQKGFSSAGIQSMLIDEAIPFMNEKMTYYMDKLSAGRYMVTFDTLKANKSGEFKDKISVNVFDNVTHADSRVKLSGGQERIIDIGTILTLCDLQSMIQDVEFNLILFDEIFDALDDENIGYVSNLIRQVANNKWVGIVSHRHIDQIEADDVLNFMGEAKPMSEAKLYEQPTIVEGVKEMLVEAAPKKKKTKKPAEILTI
ncbi:hypothetical protein KAR91_62695 [Candidatus Pacearchaeota archaeon]|nr:hypothetical protein [Candidatus Pacearchaeota archaeon]